jgi:hypothetical protein
MPRPQTLKIHYAPHPTPRFAAITATGLLNTLSLPAPEQLAILRL